MGGPAVTVEVLLLRVTDEGWAYRRATSLVGRDDEPCDVARQLATGPRQGRDDHPCNVASQLATGPRQLANGPRQLATGPRQLAAGPRLLHSTSWRHEPGDGILLTYAAYPDPTPWAAASLLGEPHLAHGRRPDTPRPSRLQLGHVAGHAVRHLAFLSRTDPVLMTVIADDPPLAAMLQGVRPEPAARL